jgi:effector-binding domain-containing protein
MKNVIGSVAFIGLVLCLASSKTHADDKTEKKYEFKVETLKVQPTVTIRFKVAPESAKITAKYGEVFTAIFTHVISNGGEPMGMPFGRYHGVSEEALDIEAGVRVTKAIKGKGDIKASELPAGKVATTTHYGPYEKLGIAHEALSKWAADNGYEPTGGIWETYVTDPGQEQDQSKWQTELCLPITKKGAAKSTK